MSNSLDPDQAHCFVGPDLGPNCLQKLSVDDTSRQNSLVASNEKSLSADNLCKQFGPSSGPTKCWS